MKHKIEVGQTVWYAERTTRGEINPNNLKRATVSSVGRKYFTITGEWLNAKIGIDTLLENVDSFYKKQVFLSVEDCEALFLRGKYLNHINCQSWVSLNNLSTEKLKAIYDILTENENHPSSTEAPI